MPYRPSTYTLAWEALRLYREAMREFVIENLKREYKDLWMAQGVEKHFPIDQIEDLQRILGQRKRAAVVSAQVETLEDMLDISHFKHIILSNWKPVFEKVLGDTTIVDSWIAEVTAARNTLAHWSGDEVPRKDAMRVVDTCERVVRSISPERAEELLAIWQSLDMMGRDETPDTRRATIVFEDGDAPKRATVIFDEPAETEKE